MCSFLELAKSIANFVWPRFTFKNQIALWWKLFYYVFYNFFGTFKKTFEILNRNIWHHYNVIWLLQFCKNFPINTSTLICDNFCFHVHIFSKPTSCQFTFFYQLDWAYVVCFDRIFAPFCDTILTSVRTERRTRVGLFGKLANIEFLSKGLLYHTTIKYCIGRHWKKNLAVKTWWPIFLKI